MTLGTLAEDSTGRAALGAVAAGLPPAQAWDLALPRRHGSEIHVRSRRQLLFDDFFIATGFWNETANHPERIPHNIRWTLGRVERAEQPVLQPDRPWEDWAACLVVLYDGGRYRGWYAAKRNPEPGFFVSYAQSEDGITWRKPILGLYEKNGSKQNNVVFEGPDAWGTHLGNVFIDPSAKSEERYKMFYSAWESRHAYPFVENVPFTAQAGVVRGAFSSDGLHWTQYPEIFFGGFADGRSVATFDPVLGKYVAYIRWGGKYGELEIAKPPVRGEVRGRSISRMESWDYHKWTPPEPNFVAEFQDGLDVDIYTPGYSRYEEAHHAHFLFPGVFHHWDGLIDTQVAVSRDGKTWLRPTRAAFISPNAEGIFDNRLVRASPGIIPSGRGQLALYYRGDNVPHAPHPGVPDPPATTRHITATGRVVFKRDRIVGIEGGREGGGFATRRLLFEGKRLVVNAEPTGPDPRLEVELIAVGVVPSENKTRGKFMEDAPCPGCSLEDSIPITGDELDGVVRWKTRTEVGEWAGKPVRLRFRLRSMRIYAFQFVD